MKHFKLLDIIKKWSLGQGEPLSTARLDKCREYTLQLIIFERVDTALEILKEEAHASNLGLNVEWHLYNKFVKRSRNRSFIFDQDGPTSF